MAGERGVLEAPHHPALPVRLEVPAGRELPPAALHLQGGVVHAAPGVNITYRVLFVNFSPLNLATFQSLYNLPYSNFFSPILLLGLGLSQI